jgi:hypothetical protein
MTKLTPSDARGGLPAANFRDRFIGSAKSDARCPNPFLVGSGLPTTHPKGD